MRYIILLLMLTGCSLTMDNFIVDSWVIENVDSGKVGDIVFYDNGSMIDNENIITTSQKYEIDGSILHLIKDNKYVHIIDQQSKSFKGLHGTDTYYQFKRLNSLDKGECAKDGDCLETQACLAMKCFDVVCDTVVIAHKCKECSTRSDCKQNEICTENNCILLECLDDDDCKDDKTCKDNKCQDIVCADNSVCKDGYYCESSICKKFQCQDNSDCKINEKCTVHECAEIVCSKDSDCRGDSVCEETKCVEPECVDNDDCPDNESCVENVCAFVEVEPGIDRVVVAPDSNLDPGDTFEVTIYLTKKADFVAYLEISSFDIMNVVVVEDEDEHRFIARVPTSASSRDYNVIAKVNIAGEFFRVEKEISVD